MTIGSMSLMTGSLSAVMAQRFIGASSDIPERPSLRQLETAPTSQYLTPLYQLLRYPDEGRFRLIVDSQAGGFPKITHGGLLVDIGVKAVSILKDSPELPLPYSVALSMPQSLAPGEEAGKPAEYDLLVDTKDKKVLVQFGEPKQGNPIRLSWQPIEAADLKKATLLPKVGRRGVERFHCIDSCVAFGKGNTHGLGLEVYYRRVRESIPYMWTWLRAGSSLAEQAMAVDELAWWMGAHVAGLLGVTATVKMNVRQKAPLNERLLALATPPDKVRKGGRNLINVAIVNQYREVLVDGQVLFMPSEAAARAGMAGDIEPLLGRLKALNIAV